MNLTPGFIPPPVVPLVPGAANGIVATGGLLGGAIAGAKAGAFFGPKGAVAGAVAGALLVPLLFPPPAQAPGTEPDPGLDPGLNPGAQPQPGTTPWPEGPWSPEPDGTWDPAVFAIWRVEWEYYNVTGGQYRCDPYLKVSETVESTGQQSWEGNQRNVQISGFPFRKALTYSCGSPDSGSYQTEEYWRLRTLGTDSWRTRSDASAYQGHLVRDGIVYEDPGQMRSMRNIRVYRNDVPIPTPDETPLPQPEPEPKPRPLPIVPLPMAPPITDPDAVPEPLPEVDPQPDPLTAPSPDNPTAPPITIPKAPPAEPVEVPDEKPGPSPLPLPTEPGVVPLPQPIPGIPPITEPTPDPQIQPAPQPAPNPVPGPGPVPIPDPDTDPAPDPDGDPNQIPVTPVVPGPTLPGVAPVPLPIGAFPIRWPWNNTPPQNNIRPINITNPNHHFPVSGGPPVSPGGTRGDIGSIAAEVGRIEQKGSSGLDKINSILNFLDLLNDALGDGVMPAYEWRLQGICEDVPEGEDQPYHLWNGDELPPMIQNNLKLDHLAQMLQVHLGFKTPICKGSHVQGEWRTVHFISDEPSGAHGGRLSKRFRYRSLGGGALADIIDHWSGFTWSAGPVIVKHKDAWWGTPQVWASSGDEGKRVIRHAAAEAGIDPDQTGRWEIGGTSHPRYGLPGTMRVNRKGGYWWITARDGPDERPIVGTAPPAL